MYRRTGLNRRIPNITRYVCRRERLFGVASASICANVATVPWGRISSSPFSVRRRGVCELFNASSSPLLVGCRVVAFGSGMELSFSRLKIATRVVETIKRTPQTWRKPANGRENSESNSVEVQHFNCQNLLLTAIFSVIADTNSCIMNSP